MTKQLHRILRNYRNITPTKFYLFNVRVRTALTDTTRIPETIWGNTPLFSTYLAASDKHTALYHESMLGSKLVIAEREVVQAQLVIYLDQIASLLEMAAVSTPEVLIASGFDLAKERRGHRRAKETSATPSAERDEPGEGESNPPA